MSKNEAPKDKQTTFTIENICNGIHQKPCKAAYPAEIDNELVWCIDIHNINELFNLIPEPGSLKITQLPTLNHIEIDDV